MQACVLCNWSTEEFILARPIEGGPRKPIFVCEGACKERKKETLAENGLKEANDILGWDVFRPIFTVD